MNIEYDEVLTGQSYLDQLFAFLLAYEGDERSPYLDTHANTYVTIGIGFNIETNLAIRDLVYKELGFRGYLDNPDQFSTEVQAREQYYLDQLNGALNAGSTNQNTLATLHNLMAQRAQDATYQGSGVDVSKASFSFSAGQAGLDEMKRVFDVARLEFESKVDTLVGNIPPSTERIAMVSMAYTSLLDQSPSFRQAIADGNRARAYYQLRFGSNPSRILGTYNRRIAESDLFGLYNDPSRITDDEAKNVVRYLERYRDYVVNDYLPNIRRKLNDGTFIAAPQPATAFTEPLQPAIEHLVVNFGAGVAIQHIIVGDNPNTGAARDDVLNGKNTSKNESDLIFGEGGNDTIRSGSGDDVIYGGTGNDALHGGTGNDVYVYDPGDGFDRVYDNDGSIYFNSNSALTGGERLGTNLARSSDGRYVYLGNLASALTVVDTHHIQGSVTVESFANGDLGITLTDPAAPSPDNILQGTSGDNTTGLIAKKDSAGNVTTEAIYGLAGNDVLDGNGGQNILLSGGAGHDIIHADYNLQTLSVIGARMLGDSGHDILFGGLNDDFIEGGTDNDFAEGRSGSDVIKGDAGRDWLDGQDGNDVIIGGAEELTVSGGQVLPDDDKLFGGAGDDFLAGGGQAAIGSTAIRRPPQRIGTKRLARKIISTAAVRRFQERLQQLEMCRKCRPATITSLAAPARTICTAVPAMTFWTAALTSTFSKAKAVMTISWAARVMTSYGAIAIQRRCRPTRKQSSRMCTATITTIGERVMSVPMEMISLMVMPETTTCTAA